MMLNWPVGGFSVMATPLDSKEVVFLEELVMSLVVSQDAMIKLLIEKGYLRKR